MRSTATIAQPAQRNVSSSQWKNGKGILALHLMEIIINMCTASALKLGIKHCGFHHHAAKQLLQKILADECPQGN